MGQGFRPDSKLMQAVCSCVASQMLSKTDKQKIDGVFRALDRKRNGVLDITDLEAAFEEYYHHHRNDDNESENSSSGGGCGCSMPTSAELDRVFSNVDTDGNGMIQ